MKNECQDALFNTRLSSALLPSDPPPPPHIAHNQPNQVAWAAPGWVGSCKQNSRATHTSGVEYRFPPRSKNSLSPCLSGAHGYLWFVLPHLLLPVDKFPLPAWVAADDVSVGSGSRDPARSGRPPAEHTLRGEPMAAPGLPLSRWIMPPPPAPGRGSLLLLFCDVTTRRRVEIQLRVT